jgi:oligopeptide/dipeptide ABC transporter ATP-binding protein
VDFPTERMGAARTLRAVDGVSVTLERGRVLGLVGESGCGKSVTALSIIGLCPAPGRVTAGSVVFEGKDITRAGEPGFRALRGSRIGFVFQEPMAALNPVFTIGDQIAESLVVHRRVPKADAWKRAIALLDAVRIPKAADRVHDYPHQLSGGQRQRVLLAAALACDPPLLIADEPTTALDVTVQAEVLDLLRATQAARGLAILFISHDLAVVSSIADRIAVMYAGRIVEEGPAADVISTPMHPYTRGLLASRPGASPGSRLLAIPGVVPDMAAPPPGCAFAPRCPDHTEACDRRPPDAIDTTPGRSVRCVLYEGGAACR